jgi:hypothetical protein
MKAGRILVAGLALLACEAAVAQEERWSRVLTSRDRAVDLDSLHQCPIHC